MMSIRDYFKKLPISSSLPSPQGELALSVPSRAISAANREVLKVLEAQTSAGTAKRKQRGPYRKYSAKERA